jgi:hypothetical protein
MSIFNILLLPDTRDIASARLFLRSSIGNVAYHDHLDNNIQVRRVGLKVRSIWKLKIMKCKPAFENKNAKHGPVVVSNRGGMLNATSANRKNNRNNIVQRVERVRGTCNGRVEDGKQGGTQKVDCQNHDN